jgi:pyridinium-3,5-biscarboxylic acid mononucleotide sulfurtransferase
LRSSGHRAGFGADILRVVEDVDDPDLVEKMARLDVELRRLGRVVVAFSGGADSSFLAAFASRSLGRERVHAVTAVSPSLAGEEEADCRSLASEWDLRWTPVATDEMERAAYRVNDTDRCFHCKAELMDVVGPIAAVEGAIVVLGVNVDDLGDHRPGQKAAEDGGAVFPLVAAGFTKSDVRSASRQLGLRTWDKPAAACLASRVPYGTEVTVGLLGRIDRAEAALHGLGLRQVRVRHYDETARIEVDLDELATVIEEREAIVAAVKSAGYRYVTIDLEGFRSGNLNG